MATIPSTNAVPARIAEKIARVRRRAFTGRVASGALTALAVALAIFSVALAIDWWVVPFETGFRSALTRTALWLMVGAALVCLVRAVLRGPALLEVTGAIDEQVPQLQERWTAVTALARSTDTPEVRGAESLIRQVFRESEQLEPLVDARRIRLAVGLKTAALLLAGAMLLFLVPAISDWPQMSVLIRRFAHPAQNISLTEIRSESGDLLVPRHASIALTARLASRLRPEATLIVREADGSLTEHRLNPAEPGGARFVFPVKDVTAPFAYRFRAGDGQTDWHQVTLAERPAFKAIHVAVVPPAYSKLPAVEQAGLPQAIQVLEGSRLTVTFESSLALESLVLEDDRGGRIALPAETPTTFRYDGLLAESWAFRPIMTTPEGQSNQRPPRCEIVVYRDQAPSVEVANPGEEVGVRPDDRITIAFDARDDFGIARAELVVYDPRDPQGKELAVEEIPLGGQKGTKAVHGQVDLDLKPFALRHGAELQYSIRVYDTKDLVAALESATRTGGDREVSQAPAETGEPQDTPAASANDSKPAGNNDTPAGQPGAESESLRQPSPAGSNPAKQSERGGELTGAPRPPNDMVKRLLDAGAQCSACQRRRITIDEWAGSFASQVLDKLQLQIDPVLKELRESLTIAKKALEPAADHVRAGKEWGRMQRESVASANEALLKSETLVRDLTARTEGTPYAFIGLQLQDISQLHIRPARDRLSGPILLDAMPRADDLRASLAHVRQALELLDALTRQYETVKLDQRIADATARVQKMYQIFLEGTFAMLQSRKPPLNPKQRSLMEFELSEEFLANLQKLLEKKQDILAELAKILSGDPRLLQRYMARTRLEATTLRDQLTLLARRQQELHEEVVAGLPPKDDKTARFELRNQRTTRARAAARIAEDAAKLADNFVVWTPLDLDVDQGELARTRELAERIVACANDLARESAAAAPEPGLAAAQVLYRNLTEFEEKLPNLLDVHDSDKLATHVANRLVETERLITEVSGWSYKETKIAEGRHHLAAEVDQHRIAVDSGALTRKLASLEAQCRGMTVELGDAAKEFMDTMEGDLLNELESSQSAFRDNDLSRAIAHQRKAVDAFARAEQQFDAVIDAMIEHLDSLPYERNPPPPDPDAAESLDELLALLEDEAQAAESLGIPCRPSNLMIEKDWLKPGSMPGAGSGGAGWSVRAAVQQARDRRDRAEKLQHRARKRLADMARGQPAEGRLPDADAGERRWNTLGSHLEDLLRQGRKNVPPEQYRQAIERYFESLAGRSQQSREE